jgi:opacity protein-like surface antigen
VSGSTTDALRVGAVIGIGVEKKLTEAVSLGLEYNYVDLGSLDVTAPAGLGGIFRRWR